MEIENKKIFIIHYPMNEEGEYKKHIKNPTIEENKKCLVRLIRIFIYMDILIWLI